MSQPQVPNLSDQTDLTTLLGRASGFYQAFRGSSYGDMSSDTFLAVQEISTQLFIIAKLINQVTAGMESALQGVPELHTNFHPPSADNAK